MNRKYLKWFLTADGAGNGGGEVQPKMSMIDMLGDPDAERNEPELDEPEVKEEKPEAEVVEVTPTPAPAPAFDAKALAEAFKSAGIGAPVQAAPQPKLTPEEVKKQLKYWEPTAEWVQRFDNLDTREAALAEMVRGQSEHAYTLAEAKAAEIERRLEERYAPVMQRVAAREDEEKWDAFGKRHKALAAPELRPLLTTVLASVVQSGRTFSNLNEVFDAVAAGAAPVIQQFSPGFKLPGATAPTTQPGRGSSIPVTSPGGGGANGGTSGMAGSGGKSLASTLLGKPRR